jgi:dipeptidyl aminopeptidase/acylaminoacyl peptidase
VPSLRELLELRVAVPADAGPTDALVQANLTGTMQLYRVPLTGGELEQLTDEAEPVGGRFLPDGRIVATMDAGGNERTQLYLLEPGAPLEPLVVEPEFIHWGAQVSPDGRLLAYSCNRRNGVDFDVFVRDLESGEERTIFAPGGLCESLAFSPDGRSVAVEQLTEKPGDNELWLAPLDGEPELLSPHDDEAFFGTPAWAGGHLYYATNSGRDTQAIGRHGEGVVLESHWDLTCSADPAGRWLLVAENADGYSRLELRDGATLELHAELPLPGRGVVEDVALPRPVFTPDGGTLVYGFTSPVEPGDVWAHEIASGETRRLTRTHEDLDDLVEPELHRFDSFDGESVPLYLYENEGRPVVIDIHGGPESQERPVWNPLIQWFVANGYAVAAPNVRGSTGYGRRYEHLDDVRLRLDSVLDVVALHDWLGPERPAVLWGGSYGGYMVLAGLAFHPDRWAAGVDIVGISSLVTFLENTSAYRRAFREREYGSLEHDREFLESVSPLSRVEQIRAPLFVIHGANDPRVPLSEAQQLHATLTERGVPCELLVYEDEGHGLKKLRNRLDAYPRAVEFLGRVLETEELDAGAVDVTEPSAQT